MTDSSSDDVIVKVSIKFLLSNGVTGSLIGSGGKLFFYVVCPFDYVLYTKLSISK